MTRVLLVAEATPRSQGVFRRRWVRALHRRYLRRYREALAAAAGRLAATHEVTVLAGRDALDPARLPSAAVRRVYEDELLHSDSEALAFLTRELIAEWWPAREEPGLTFDEVWLPDLMPVTKSILLRVDVVEYLGIIVRTLDEVKPDGVVLLTGASIAERMARALAVERAIPVRVARRSPAAGALAAAGRALRRREERRALAAHLNHRRASVPTPSAPVLLSVSHARHFMVVDPLVRALTARGRPSAVLVATNENRAMRAPLSRALADGAVGGHLMDHLPRAEARRLVRDLRPVSRRLLARLKYRQPGGPLAAIVAPYARDAVTLSLATARLYLAAAGRALDAHRPAAVVITSDRRMSERALALAARRRGIPSLLFYGGALLGRDRTNLFDVGDRILVLGEHVRRGLIEQGIDARRLVAVGDPRSNDARLVPPERLRAEVRQRFGLPSDRPLVVMVSKYASLLFSADEKQAFYRTVRDALRELGEVGVVIKVHPNENLALLRRQVAEWRWPDVPLTQEYDIHRLFAAADAAVMVTSMAGIEAMALGCPVIAVQMPGKDFEGGGMPAYVSQGAVERVDVGDTKTLITVLRCILTDASARAALVERGRRFAAPYLHPVDGALGDRLQGVIDEIRLELTAEGVAAPPPDAPSGGRG
jgi:glycosyltransferase involved in cell wall biosynthesis